MGPSSVAFLVLKFLLLLVSWSAARGGSVTDVHDVTGLIHGPAAGADAFCIYLESFSFSLFSVP